MCRLLEPCVAGHYSQQVSTLYTVYTLQHYTLNKMCELCTVNNVYAVRRKMFTVLYTVYTDNCTVHSV